MIQITLIQSEFHCFHRDGGKKEKRTESYLFGKKSHQATPRKCLMYRNNQSRRARNGNDENREKIETRSDRLFQPFSCFNFPPKIEILRKRLFPPLFSTNVSPIRLFRYFIDRVIPERRKSARFKLVPEKKVFLGGKAQEKEREKLSGTQS